VESISNLYNFLHFSPPFVEKMKLPRSRGKEGSFTELSASFLTGKGKKKKENTMHIIQT
jgi:hypothetical protein